MIRSNVKSTIKISEDNREANDFHYAENLVVLGEMDDIFSKSSVSIKLDSNSIGQHFFENYFIIGNHFNYHKVSSCRT